MALRQHYWNPRTNEACFVDETQLIYAFNERQDAGTWSDLHVHPDWGELLFVATGSIVLCSETGNFLGQGYRATWVPPGVQHEWYLPEASWNRSLFFHASLFENSPRFRQCHGLEMSPLLRELLFAVDDLKPDFTPFVLLGKVHPAGDRTVLPVGGEFAHAVNDGGHISGFFKELEETAAKLFPD